MNSNRRVLHFVTGSVCIYLLMSLAAQFLKVEWMPFRRVNLVADIMYGNDSVLSSSNGTDSAAVTIEKKADKNFDLYKRGRFITNFSADPNSASLEFFMQRLDELKSGKRKKLRIAYFGDSMIEGDLLTQTLRELLQKAFGGSGVGYVPITSQVSKFRQTVVHNYSGGWTDENFKGSNNGKLYLSGHLFRGNGDWVQMIDQTIKDSAAVIEKSLLCGNTNGEKAINVNGYNHSINGRDAFNRIPLASDASRGIKLAVSDNRLPLYGVSFESATGIFVDNFSFRGITGIEYAKLDPAFLRAVAENNNYDLIVFQYGVNLLFRPNDRNFNWYAKAMLPIVTKMRECFPKTDFLLVSTADRAFRYGGEYRSAVGIDSLIRIQATIAYETGSNFYNQFASMGGANSIVDWARMNPSLANKDYIHPNHRGAAVLATYLYESIMNEYGKHIRARK
jgi:lysophospholipase L1-like esterase